MAAMLVLVVAVPPVAYYREQYTYGKRLREVSPGRVYRSGQMSEAGFRDAIRQYGIRTIINLQNELPDPEIRPGLPESEFCRALGVKYVFLLPDLLDRYRIPRERPAAIDKFLDLMDDEANYPVLIHCRAGLHRTGVLVGLYRLEYDRWLLPTVVAELIENGFTRGQATSRNDYVKQYLTTYRPRSRPPASAAGPAPRFDLGPRTPVATGAAGAAETPRP